MRSSCEDIVSILRIDTPCRKSREVGWGADGGGIDMRTAQLGCCCGSVGSPTKSVGERHRLGQMVRGSETGRDAGGTNRMGNEAGGSDGTRVVGEGMGAMGCDEDGAAKREGV